MDNSVKHLLEFGPFRIDPEQRLLLRDEQPIPLSPKAFDLLLVLFQEHDGCSPSHDRSAGRSGSESCRARPSTYARCVRGGVVHVGAG